MTMTSTTTTRVHLLTLKLTFITNFSLRNLPDPNRKHFNDLFYVKLCDCNDVGSNSAPLIEINKESIPRFKANVDYHKDRLACKQLDINNSEHEYVAINEVTCNLTYPSFSSTNYWSSKPGVTKLRPAVQPNPTRDASLSGSPTVLGFA